MYSKHLDNAVSVEINRYGIIEIENWIANKKPLYKGVLETFKVMFAPFSIISLYTMYKIIVDTLKIDFTNSTYWKENFSKNGLDLIGFTTIFMAIVLITLFVQIAVFRLTLRSSILDFMESMLKIKSRK